MIVRNHLHCPGCAEPILVRVSVFPTDLLHFYILCPTCAVPIRGSLEGHELEDARLRFDADHSRDTEVPAAAVTVDPSAPAPNGADSLMQGLGPNALFMHMAGEQALALSVLGERTYTALRQAPTFMRAVHLYLDGNSTAYWQYLKRHFGDVLDTDTQHALAFAATAHHLWQAIVSQFLDPTWVTSADVRGLTVISEMHLAGLQKGPGYREELRRYTAEFAVVDRKLFDATEALVRSGAAWRSGVLRLASGHQASAIAGMQLLQDEFPRLRDVFQNTFEACCDSLWIIALIRNYAAHGTLEPLEGLSYLENGKERHVRTTAAFRKLVNARKLEVLRGDDRLQSVLAPLDSRLRNAIGHASARHDLQQGVIGNENGDSIDYFDFVGRVYSLLLPLSVSITALRSVRVLTAGPPN